MQPASPHRRIVHIDGYYPNPPETSHARYRRELARFRAAWSVEAAAGAAETTADTSRWAVSAGGPGWQRQNEHILLRWDDLILADRARGWPARIVLSFLTSADFIIGGAFFRYLRHAWRYALFFLYPYLWLFGTLGLAVYGAGKLITLAGFGDGPWRWLTGLVLFAILLPLISRFAFLDHLYDDWIYARRMVRHGDGAVEARLARLAAELAPHDEELLIIGHSFGAVHALDLIRAIRTLRPDGPPIRFASVGSSILKVALHGGARRLRATIAAVAQLPNVIWVDFTALNDVMNFHRKEPVTTLGLPGTPARARNVRFRQMVAPEFYAKMERNFFRLHSQFISGNDNRARYDYFMMCLGPFPLETLADSDEGAIFWLDATGGLTDAGRAALAGQDAAGRTTT